MISKKTISNCSYCEVTAALLNTDRSLEIGVIFERAGKMKNVRNVTLWSLLVLVSLAVLGCGKKDEDKPVSEVKTEAKQMSTDELRAEAMKCKEAITAKKGELEEVMAKLKVLPITEISDKDAKRIEDLHRSISALQKHFDVYYQELRKKGEDISDLKM